MKIAIIAEAAGSTNALAMTSFLGSLAEGFTNSGTPARIVGVARSSKYWIPSTLGAADYSAPWLSPESHRLRHVLEALRAGVLDESSCPAAARVLSEDWWYLELLLQRELSQYMDSQPGFVLVYPRSLAIMSTAVRVSSRLGLKVVAFSTEALSDNQIDAATRDGYVRCVAQCCDGVWTMSEYLADFWRSHGVPGERIFTCVEAVRDAFFAAELEPQRCGSAVYLGNLAHREIEYLIDVSARVSREISTFRLDVYGDAPSARRDELQRRIRDVGLAQTVKVHDSVSPLDVPDVIRRADVLLLPRASGEFSTAGFPNKLGEYLAVGRPVVVTSVGDIPKYLTHEVDALLVPPDDLETFAVAVIRILRDPEFGDNIGSEGRRLARRLSHADVVAGRAAEFLTTVGTTAASLRSDGDRVGPLRRVANACGVLTLDAKRAAVKVLRALHLKAPTPEYERGQTRA